MIYLHVCSHKPCILLYYIRTYIHTIVLSTRRYKFDPNYTILEICAHILYDIHTSSFSFFSYTRLCILLLHEYDTNNNNNIVYVCVHYVFGTFFPPPLIVDRPSAAVGKPPINLISTITKWNVTYMVYSGIYRTAV